ncbi:MAG: 50S ribosomal protein L9 [Clostridia bacterium]|nr:50S ribosomal protein L9 [Clostridia bacterium]MBR5009326.1 50S ribosomal protein L9 [Clostridia bacterium]MBR5257917.1 50S ribosomal protein L9 [Clostridia bacterium]MBR5986852.1 50S ribosomal protein L9 [Clostridia bacterium]MBR6008235.1 50S ribosomal protein L9 [Clostridia bacterium]
MKVLLLQDVRGTGKKDDIVEVSEGYGRNYLIPRKLAKEATAETLNSVSRAKAAEAHREEVKRQDADVKSRELKGKVIQITARGGENGKLYGAVTNDMIAEALKAQHGIEVDKRKIEQEEPIKSAGQSFVTVKLYSGINVRMIVHTTVVSK